MNVICNKKQVCEFNDSQCTHSVIHEQIETCIGACCHIASARCISTTRAWLSNRGSLMLSEYAPGVTSKILDDKAARYYGGKYFVGEGMTWETASTIAEALGFEWIEDAEES